MAGEAKKKGGNGDAGAAEAKLRNALRSPKTGGRKRTRKKAPPRPGFFRRLWRWSWRGALALPVLFVLWVALLAFVDPPHDYYMRSEAARLGSIKAEWVDIEDIAPVMARSVVAAEDANFCLHWGFDMAALRAAIEDGGKRGASTISQQVVKNVFLWQGRSYLRKALEAALTPVVELLWSKRRIIEVYLNVAEFDEGVFGVKAAAQHYFGVSPAKLSPVQAARLAVVLPNPKEYSAVKPTEFLQKQARQAESGAETIEADGRAACFER